MNVRFGSVVVYYNLKFPTYLKYNLNYGYISSLTLFPWKSVFKSEFYSKFVLFGFKAKHHILSLNHRGGGL